MAPGEWVPDGSWVTIEYHLAHLAKGLSSHDQAAINSAINEVRDAAFAYYA